MLFINASLLSFGIDMDDETLETDTLSSPILKNEVSINTLFHYHQHYLIYYNNIIITIDVFNIR